MLEVPILAAVPQAQDEDFAGCDLVAQFVIAHRDAADFAGCVGVEALAEPWKVAQAVGGVGELPDHAGGGFRRDRREKIVQAHQVGGSARRPADLHGLGGGSGVSVARLSAQAVTAAASITRPASTSASASKVSRCRSSS